ASWDSVGCQGALHFDVQSLQFVAGLAAETLLGSTDGGVFRTSDGAATCPDLSKGLEITQFYRACTSGRSADRVMGGAQDNGTNQLLAGVWRHVNGFDGMECAVDYTNPDVLYSTSQAGPLYRCDDDAATFWSDIEPGVSSNWVTKFALHPAQPSTI